MNDFNFADSYKRAALNLTTTQVTARTTAFNEIREDIDWPIIAKLTRLYYRLSSPDDAEWFRRIFAEADPTFTLIDNEREVGVLAAGLIEAAILDRKIYAALAPLTASACGLRSPLVRPELLSIAQNTLETIAIDARRAAKVDATTLGSLARKNQPIEIAAFAAAPDLMKVSEVMTSISGAASESLAAFASEVANVIIPLSAKVDTLNEEVSMLWWFVSGWSSLLNVPLNDVDPDLVPILCGLDLADLCRTMSGPVAAPAVLQKAINSIAASRAEVSLDKVVTANHEVLSRLKLVDALKGNEDLFPVLGAFSKASEIGSGTSWHESYQKAAQLIPSMMTFKPLDIAMQVYRERLLLSAF